MTLDTFFKKFDQFAEAPNAVAKMRELVVQLAVQGGLVPHLPAEPPVAGSSLKDVVPINTTNIPKNWRVLLLADAVKNRSGNSKLIKGTLFDSQASKLFQGFSASGADVWCETYEHEGDAIIISAVGARCGKAFKASGKWCAIANTNITRPDPKLFDFDFAYLVMNDERFWVRGGTAQPFVKFPPSLSRYFAFPPLAEQKRIVAKVDELMALCDRLEAQQQERDAQASALARASLARFAQAPTPANLNLLFHKSYSISPADLRKAILAMAVRGKLLPQNSKDESAEKLFARIHSIKENLIKERTIKRASVEPNPGKDTCAPLPTGWIWTRLGNTFDVRDGTHDTPKYTKEGYPLITSKNIYSGSLLFDGANLISENDHRQICERSKVDRNDILFAMIGSIGNPVVVDTDKEFSIKNVALFKYYEAADSEPGFLLLYLKLVAEEMRAKAAGGVQAFVSLGFLRNYVFPLPPLAEQRRIVAKVDQLMALVDQLETQLAASRATAKNLLEAVVAELTASSSRNHEDLVQAE